MSVELLVQHPGGEWMEVEVGPMESLAGLKERVASQSGMCVNTFDLSFEGEVFGDSDGRLVGELPFEDQSELQLVLSKKEVALHHLKELGWAGKDVTSLAYHKSGEYTDLSVEGRQDLDRKLCEVLATMMEAGMCNDGQKRDLVNIMSRRGFIQCVDFLLAAGADMRCALKEAVLGRQVAMIQFLLSNGVSIADSYGYPFGPAVASGNTEIISMFLEAGAGLNLKVYFNYITPLIIATQVDNISTIALLLEKSADPNLCCYYGTSPLHHARSTEAASLLLQHGAAVNCVNSSDTTPLHKASQQGHIDVVSSLLAWGADVNAKTCGSETPLHLAKNTGIAELLLEASCDVNAQDEKGNTACHAATLIDNRYCEPSFRHHMAVLLRHGADVNLKNKNDQTLLHLSVLTGVGSIIRGVLAASPDVDVQDNEGNTALHLVSRAHDSSGIVPCLLRHHPNLNLKTNKKKQTPLHLFVLFSRDLDAMQNYLAASPDVNAQDNEGNTALHLVSALPVVSKDDKTALLLRHGADVRLKNNKGRTPIHLAVRLDGSLDIVRNMLAAPSDVNAQDNEGNTALHLVVNPFVASLILRSGADVNVRNNKGQTPLHIFVGAGLIDLVVCLLEEASPDANVNARDNAGRTPLHTVSDTVAKQLGNQYSIGGSCSVTVMKNGQRQNFTSDLHREREMMSLLMSHGADPDAKDDYDEVCSHLVSSDRCPSAVVAVKGVYKASSSDEDIPLLHFKTSRCGGKVDTRPEGHFRKRKAKHRHSDGLYMRIEELRKEPCLPFEGREANPSVSYLDALKGVGQ